jgi:integrase/recombinase XerD
MPSQNDPSKPALTILTLFDTFTAERRYLQNVSPKTLEWYQCSWKAFRNHLIPAKDEAELRIAVRQAVMAMAESGSLKPTSINDYSRCINAFCRWLHTEGHISTPIHLAKLKTPEKVPTMMTAAEVERFIRYVPKNRIERRIHAISLVVLDTGLRITEVLNLRKQDVDLDNLLMKVEKGKGDRQRVVPFTLALRRLIFRYIKTECPANSDFIFATRNGSAQTYRNALRQLKAIGSKLKIPDLRFHSMRHLFATHYLRSGGSVALLRRILGHAALETVLIYEHLLTDDLSEAHNGHSILARHG